MALLRGTLITVCISLATALVLVKPAGAVASAAACADCSNCGDDGNVFCNDHNPKCNCEWQWIAEQ